MRCPKCQYISFGAESRCRNCGYDFSLAAGSEPLDLPIKDGSEHIGPLRDLPLASPSSRLQPHEGTRASEVPASPSRTTTRPDLPLFSAAASDDAPLVTPPAVPRAPLSVRRAPPVITRPRPSAPADDGAESEATENPARNASIACDRTMEAGYGESAAAPPGARLAAGILDLSLIGAIDVAVIYLTLRLCNLGFADAMVLPKLPMLAFFVLLNGGYLVLFTAAGGQTIGKMAARIKVVSQAAEPARRVTFGAAVMRAAGLLAAVLPAGLGLLPIVFRADRRGVHDRLANTRVVRS